MRPINENSGRETRLYELLRQATETVMKKKMQKPADFDLLHEKVFERTRVMISSSTLKRFWGYMQSDHSPSIQTLDTLAKFCGYTDFGAFGQKPFNKEEMPSCPLLGNHIDVAENLEVGDEVTLYWLPDRTCHVRYEGNTQFVVTSSENTRLRQGDTFRCNVIIEGEPLYLNHLVQDGRPPVNYSCGRQGGVLFKTNRRD